MASFEAKMKQLADGEEVKMKQQKDQDQEEEFWRRME